jgi:hypothetical protein
MDNNSHIEYCKNILRAEWAVKGHAWRIWFDKRDNTYSHISNIEALTVIDYMRQQNIETLDDFRLLDNNNIYGEFMLWIV